MAAYYNDVEPYVCQWLRNLIAARLIAPGDVDERSISDVQPDDLRGYAQCHFFAGIGGWSYALRLAGWPDDRPVWTGSCPCQPFSAAGAQRGSDDERHLWPAFFRLIRECRPATVLGEQVAGAAGLAWLDHVCADMESEGYTAAAADLPAACVGAPHIRQRLWWVAHAECGTAERQRFDVAGETRDAESEARQRQRIRDDIGAGVATDVHDAARRGANGDVANPTPRGLGEHGRTPGPSGHAAFGDETSLGRPRQRDQPAYAVARQTSPWSDLVWLPCSDGKIRPTQPGIFPLVAGISKGLVRSGDLGASINADASPEARLGRLRGYGNSIVPQVAAAFIESVMECMP